MIATQLADLLKAARRSLAYHFKKMAAHNESKAAAHEKMMLAHKAHAEHHESMMGEEGANKTYHKSSMSFHKSKASHHEKLNKAHASYAVHCNKMVEAHECDDEKKVYKILEIEEPGDTVTEPNKPEVVAKAAEPAVPTAPAAQPAAPAAPAVPAAKVEGATDIATTIEKALNEKLSKAIDSAFERVLNSPEFGKAMDERIAGKMLEKLGTQPAPTEVKTFAVPRTSQAYGSVGASVNKVEQDLAGVPPEFADLVTIEHRD